MNIRRTLCFIITVALTGRLCYQLAWAPELRERLLDNPWQSVGLLTLAVVAIAALIWAAINHGTVQTFLAFGLGIATAVWGMQLLHGIAWEQVGIILGALAGLVVLWFLTTWDEIAGT